MAAAIQQVQQNGMMGGENFQAVPVALVAPVAAGRISNKKRTLRGYQKCRAANASIVKAAKMITCFRCKKLDGPSPVVCAYCNRIVCGNCMLEEAAPSGAWQWMKQTVAGSSCLPKVNKCPNCLRELPHDKMNRIPWLATLQNDMKQVIALRANIQSNVMSS